MAYKDRMSRDQHRVFCIMQTIVIAFVLTVAIKLVGFKVELLGGLLIVMLFGYFICFTEKSKEKIDYEPTDFEKRHGLYE